MADDQLRVGEAGMEPTAEGLRPIGEGWFVVNVAELAARRNDLMGITCSPEPEDARFPEFGFNLRVLEPGQFNARYHRENDQEAFLVLSGECRLIVEGEGFPVDAVAARYGASVAEPTGDPQVAYADVPHSEPARLPWPP